MYRIRHNQKLPVYLATLGFSLLTATAASAQTETFGASGKTVMVSANPAAVKRYSDSDLANAKSKMPMLTDPSQVPGLSERIRQGYGSLNHPFTTKGAYSQLANGIPVITSPWKSTGKLIMTFPNGTFVCTASVVKKGILVTAAHCVHNYGQGASGWASSISFQPARHGSNTKFGTWDAITWYIPTVYYNGTDTCTVSGVVCENDVAVIVMEKGPAPFSAKEIGQLVGRYGIYGNGAGFTSFLGKSAAQITQLGYPVAFDSGLKMIRTDSLGYMETPNNVILGSDQTGGSSGGPWILNFGRDPISTSSTPNYNVSNQVVATTSWGYVSSTLKVQGASYFANNNAFPAPGSTNIKTLLDDACAAYPSKC